MKRVQGEPVTKRFTSEAVEAMFHAIDEAGGNEVFFAGGLNKEGIVTGTRVVARGHQGAVPAFLDAVGQREVVIHNHPSGNITPSGADLQLAALFGNNGNGVYIIDNSVERVYVVVEPFLQKDIKTLNPDTLSKAFDPKGKLARSLPAYEVRPQQSQMLSVVARAFNSEGIAVIEAPTGVGKTLDLQEQIIEKDIPMLQRCSDKPFAACLVKGRRNYLCRRKLDRAVSEATLFDDEQDGSIIRRIAEWADKTEDGSLSDLSFVPPRRVWDRLCSEADTCSMSTCPNPDKCFVGRARREMTKADLLVVNHHMLFSDISVKKEMGRFSTTAVLPPFHRVILDEAHNVEEAATEYFGMEVTRLGTLATIGRFFRIEHGRERGLLPFMITRIMSEGQHLEPAAVAEIDDLIENKLRAALDAARESCSGAFSDIRKLVSERCRSVGVTLQWRLTGDVLQDAAVRDLHRSSVQPAVEELAKCVSLLEQLITKVRQLPLKKEEEEAPWLTEQLQLESYTARLKAIGAGLSEGTSAELAENTVRWIEIETNNENIVRIARRPLEVAEQPLHLPGRKQAQADLGIGGHGHGAKRLGRDHPHVVPALPQRIPGLDQGRDDPVNLRLPGVRGDGDLHGQPARRR